MKQLILGGARSGKSKIAEMRASEIAQDKNLELVYIATATAGDNEMQERIEHHKERRSQQSQCEWRTVEEPTQLAKIIKQENNSNSCLLVDCLTLWLSNCLAQDCWQHERKLFVESIINCQLDIILVSNEVGSGVVPLGELSRQFVDESGWLHQSLASHCDRVTLVTAGLPLELKPQ